MGTLLKLLGQVLVPNEEYCSGGVFVPPHLRILHLSSQVLFMSSSLLKNIILNQDLDRMGGISRIQRICERLHFPPYMMGHLTEDVLDASHPSSHIRSWIGRLSQTDLARVNLA